MTYSVVIEIYCDHPGCKAVIRQVRMNRGGLSKTWAGYLASREGWQIPGYDATKDPKKALCPKHAQPM